LPAVIDNISKSDKIHLIKSFWIRIAFSSTKVKTPVKQHTSASESQIPSQETPMIRAISLFPNDADSEIVNAMIKVLESSLKQTSGVLSISTNEGVLMSPGGPPPYARVVEFTFDSLESMMAWTQSERAQSQKEQMNSLRPVMLYYEVKEL